MGPGVARPAKASEKQAIDGFQERVNKLQKSSTQRGLPNIVLSATFYEKMENGNPPKCPSIKQSNCRLSTQQGPGRMPESRCSLWADVWTDVQDTFLNERKRYGSYESIYGSTRVWVCECVCASVCGHAEKNQWNSSASY